MADLARTGRWILIIAMALLSWRFARMPLGPAAAESFLHLPNLVFHEAGHVLFRPFGRFLSVLGGSALQVLVPIVCAVSFLRQQGNRFGCAACVWWAGQSLVDIAPYVADARALQLVLIGGYTGAQVEGHDWEYLLTHLGLLQWDRTLGRLTHVTGSLVMIGALTWAIGMVLQRREIDRPAS